MPSWRLRLCLSVRVGLNVTADVQEMPEFVGVSGASRKRGGRTAGSARERFQCWRGAEDAIVVLALKYGTPPDVPVLALCRRSRQQKRRIEMQNRWRCPHFSICRAAAIEPPKDVLRGNSMDAIGGPATMCQDCIKDDDTLIELRRYAGPDV